MSNVNIGLPDELYPKLKNFQFERKLGSGTYASVYKAINKTKNNEVCAIKCIKRSSLNETSTENLLREIEILKNIRNDHIVQLKDFQWTEHYIYLIMEFCAGGDLSAFIRSRRTIPEKYVKRFLQQIAFALKHLHSFGISHMDLKPQNILLTSVNNPSLKLGDFGFAQQLKEGVGHSLKGSPLYMAPEILKYQRYDAKVDLWSVGVILYEVIFGYAPFVSNSFAELEQKILDEKPIEIPSHVALSETCKDLLRRLLQRNPEARISFQQFFNHPFIDLEHMPCPSSYPRAKHLFERAVEADERKDNFFAQKCYLNALEYLIPAIQYEKDHYKKEEMRKKAQAFMKRAEEIAGVKPKNNDALGNSSLRPASATLTTTLKRNQSQPNESLTKATVKNNDYVVQPTLAMKSTIINDNQSSITNILLEACQNDEKAKYAILLCSRADEKMKNDENCDETLSNYQTAISHLLPLLQTLAKDSDAYKLLKKQIDKWLSNAEALKEKSQLKSQMQNLEMRQALQSFKEDDVENSSLMQCILQ